MNDWMILLILAIFGIMGYGLMGLVDSSISRHTGENDKPGQEQVTNEYAEIRKPKHTHSGLPFFLHIQR